MARRRRRTDSYKGTIELLLMIMFAIPVGIYYLCKWTIKGIAAIIGGFGRLGGSKYNKIKNVDMSQVDLMDGLAFEDFVATLLRRNGYGDVEVTKASGDYGVDVIARKEGKKIAFQCKCYSNNLGVKPVQEVYSGAGMYNAQKAVVITNAYFTRNAITLAKQLNVELWDRDALMRLMGQVQRMIEQAEPPQTTTKAPKPAKEKRKQEIQEIPETRRKEVSFDMATILGAGKYVFGEDIPLGKYNLKAISGKGMLKIQKYMDGEWDEVWENFGVEDHCAKTHFGISLPQGKYFEVDGNVVFEITKAKMIEIE